MRLRFTGQYLQTIVRYLVYISAVANLVTVATLALGPSSVLEVYPEREASFSLGGLLLEQLFQEKARSELEGGES